MYLYSIRILPRGSSRVGARLCGGWVPLCASSCDVRTRRLAFVPAGCALICRCAGMVPHRAMLVAVVISGLGCLFGRQGSLPVAGVVRCCAGIVSHRATGGMQVPTRGKQRLRRGGLSMWRHRAHKCLRAFKVVVRLCAGGLRLLSGAVLI